MMTEALNRATPARPSHADRPLAAALAVSAMALAVNGAWMLLDPSGWYSAVPGAVDSGPYNPHFVRDVGTEYVALAAALAWAARHARAAFPLTSIAALALWLHATLHAWEVVAGHGHGDSFVLAQVFLAPIVLTALAVWARACHVNSKGDIR
jgi:hypothetical protein